MDILSEPPDGLAQWGGTFAERRRRGQLERQVEQVLCRFLILTDFDPDRDSITHVKIL